VPRLPLPADTDAFTEDTRKGVRHILETRKGSLPPPSTYLTYAGEAGGLLSDLVEYLRYHTSMTEAETELAICTSARASNADYIWNAHCRLGLAAGTREVALDAVDKHAALDHLTRILAAEQPTLRVYVVDPGDMRTQLHQDAFPGEDISDRQLPEAVVPHLVALLDSDLPSGRYRAVDIEIAAATS